MVPERMIGAVLTGPEQLQIRELPVAALGAGELLLRVGAATTCGTDVKVYRRGGHPRMLKVPTLFGHEMAGTVAALGSGGHKFSVGERIVVANSAPCGECDYCRRKRHNLCRSLVYLNGAFAEYVRVPAAFVARNTYRIPDALPFARAALCEPLACVLHGLDACELERRAVSSGTEEVAEVVVFGAGPIGLLFVAALAREPVRIILADPNPDRLALGERMGAHDSVHIARGGGQARAVRAATRGGEGAEIVIDATGVPQVWRDAIDTACIGGLVNLFGGCAKGTEVPLDTHRVHYDELTIKGVYHHRPATMQRALALLSDPDFPAGLLLSDTVSIAQVESALRAMIDKRALKVVVQGTA